MLISKIKKIEGGRVIVKDSFEEILSLTPHDRFVVLHKGYRIYQNTRTGVYSAIKVKSYSPYGYRGKSLEGVKSEIDSRPKDSRTKDEVPFSQAKIVEKSAEMVWGRKPTPSEIEEIWNAVAGTGEHFWDVLKRYLEIHKPKP